MTADTTDATLAEVFAAIDDKYDGEPGGNEARAGAKRYLRSDDSETELAALAQRWHAAKQAERDAMARLTGAIIAADRRKVSALSMTRITGVNRKTIRAALGKSKVY